MSTLAHSNRFQWRAIYNDGSHLMQIDYDGTKHGYVDIDRSRLSAFEMWEANSKVLMVKFGANQRLIWRRRTEQGPEGITEVCHIIGKKEVTPEGKVYEGILGLFESDGRVEPFGKFEENHPWVFPVDETGLKANNDDWLL